MVDRFTWERAISNPSAVPLAPTAHHVLMTLAMHTSAGGTVRVSLATLGDKSRVSERTARRVVVEAMRCGLLDRVVRGRKVGTEQGSPSVYVLTLPPDVLKIYAQPASPNTRPTGQTVLPNRPRVAGIHSFGKNTRGRRQPPPRPGLMDRG